MTTTETGSNERTIDALDNLRVHQRQLDPDGCEVGVSREALNEVILAFGKLSSLRNAQSEAVAVKATAWEGHWAGCGSVSSETSCTGSKALMEQWERDGARIRPLYTHPAPQSEAVAVKELEWHGPDINDEIYARSALCVYKIQKQRNSMGFWLTEVGGNFHSIDAAKAAAQADYGQRIRSALTHPAPPLAVTDEMLRKWLLLAETVQTGPEPDEALGHLLNSLTAALEAKQ